MQNSKSSSLLAFLGMALLALSLRYVRYAFIGFWMTGGAPWAFLGLKLAEKRA